MNRHSVRAGRAAPGVDSVLAAQVEQGKALHNVGRLAEAEALYRAVLEKSPNHPEALLGLASALAQGGRTDLALPLAQKSTKVSPDWAVSHNLLAELHRGNGDYPDALKAVRRAHALAPGEFQFHCALGATLLLVERFLEGREVLEKVVVRHPREPLGWSNLAAARNHLHDFADGLLAADEAIRLMPTMADAHLNRSVSLGSLARFQESAAAAETAARLGAPPVNAGFQRAVTLLALGRFAEGWKDFEWRLPLQAPPVHASTAPQWRGETPLEGRRLLVRCEQGLGDTVQFCRFLDLAADAASEVSFEVQPALEALVARSMPRVRIFRLGDPLPEHDLQCPLMSLPLAFGLTSTESFTRPPYLHALPDRLDAWSTRLGAGPRPRVGLTCSGNPHHGMDALRSIPLETFAPLFDLNARFFLIQKELRSSDRSQVRKSGIVEISRELKDFDDTAACLSSLDLFISVDTSVAHLAGALGRQVWLLNAFSPDFRWRDSGETTAWYPSMKIYRQTAFGDWPDVIERVRRDLETFTRRWPEH